MDNEECKPKEGWSMRPFIAVTYLIGAFAIFIMVILGKADLQWRDVALMIIGAIITKSGTIIDWYYGSSQDSSKKTDLLAEKKIT